MRARIRPLALLAVLACAVHAAPAGAVSENLLRERAATIVGRALAMRAARGAAPGILVRRGGRDLRAVNAGSAFVPASLMKLATTTAAVLVLGPDTRFDTTIVGAPAVDGVVRGGITFVGGGDPTLATRAYQVRHYGADAGRAVFPSGTMTVEWIAHLLERAGLSRVEGDLRVDDSLFDARRTNPGWLDSYTVRGEPDVGYLTALSVNEGWGDLRKHTIQREPTIQAGRELSRALREQGVVVTGAIRAATPPPGGVELLRVSSPPIGEIVGFVNRWSKNFASEVLLKHLGAAHDGGQGTVAGGIAAVREALAGIAIPLAGFVMTDGSGLSVRDRASPRTIASILEWMLDDPTPAGSTLRDSLPVAGKPGALEHRMARWPARHNLRGKTAMITGVRGMAGWVRPIDGEMIVYVAIFNRARSEMALGAPLDYLGWWLARLADDRL